MDKREEVGCVSCGEIFDNSLLEEGTEEGYPVCPHCKGEGTVVNFRCAVDLLNSHYHVGDLTAVQLQEYNEEYNESSE